MPSASAGGEQEVEVEAVPLTLAMAMTMASQGEGQMLLVDSKRILCMVMEAFGSKRMPQFKETECGSQGIMVAVRIDVSSARCYCGEKPDSAVIEGEPKTSRVLAERSAVQKAIKYLNDNHKIKVLHFSMKIVHGIEARSAFGHVNAALYNLDKLIVRWEITVGECKTVAINIEANSANIAYELWEKYNTLKQFMCSVVEVYTKKVANAKVKASKMEFMRSMYHKRSTAKYQADLVKGYMHTVVLSKKMILDCILDTVGSGKATYKNGPTEYGTVKGEATFNIKPMPGAKYSGNIKIKGTGLDSKSAEEDAAYKALLIIEENLNMRVHDIYNEERVHAEKEHKLLINVFEETLLEFDRNKGAWSELIDKVCKEIKRYMEDTSFVLTSDGGTTRDESYRFFAKNMEKLEKQSTKMFEECAQNFQEMDKLACKMAELKAEMKQE